LFVFRFTNCRRNWFGMLRLFEFLNEKEVCIKKHNFVCAFYVGLTMRYVDVGDDKRSLIIDSFKYVFCCLSSTSSKSKSGKFGSDEVNILVLFCLSKVNIWRRAKKREKITFSLKSHRTRDDDEDFKVRQINSCFDFL
jgi:hypothetical protein